uniref:DH domain-containing protein n=1 Tax=Arcella intermedia TaxID=1963864 RepID=A0A6B2L7U5_9EUKA
MRKARKTLQLIGEDNATNEKREFLIKEIYTTERNYYRDLTLTIELFRQPLLENKILDVETVDKIFSTAFLVIVEISATLLSQMEERLTATSYLNVQIGDIFQTMAGFLTNYTTYVNNYETAISTIREQQKLNIHFKEFKRETEKNRKCNNHTLEDFLISVIQRIPRYVLLLQDLLKHTNPNSKDFEQLEGAVKSLKGTATNINSEKKKYENMQRTIKVHQELDIDLPKGRSLSYEDELYEQNVPRKDRDTLKTRYRILVMTDCIFVVTYKFKQLQKLKKFPLAGSITPHPMDGTGVKVGSKFMYTSSLEKRKVLLSHLSELTSTLPL